MKEEKWVKIIGHTKYSVSDHGRVRNDLTMRIKKLFKNRYGGVFVVLYHDEGYKHVTRNLSHIIRQHMPPCPSDKHGVYHLDGNKSNNHIDNLVFLTNGERIKHGFKKQRRRFRGYGKPLSIEEKRIITNMWNRGTSQVKIGKHIGRSNSTISKYLSGRY
jgi:hypothetical protein